MDDKNLDLVKLGHQVRLRRKSKGWSLSDLAKESGVSKAYISDVENGAAGRPNIQYVYSLAVALGVSLDGLLRDTVRKPLETGPKAKIEELPPGLAKLQAEEKLTDDEVRALAGVSFRGERPTDEKGWRFLFEAIKMSSRHKPGK
jgi:transcriptional regulator with XRE-family HTH domain